ncbi:sugar phosphate isomerase/epimerase family protein [Brevibacillus choshinensis]|uniref:TIM barrel protein n=1 Tax=Brevibacillus choshinensis TaxID=54911 RepID=A0ABX7FTG9_BRECH|nr:TIM barrel protein [Brevibacillus choshinensis]QRG68874.1 TIM barrel protein [Brevibacillus choshinensis]
MGAIKRSQITGMNFHYLHYPLTYFLDSMVRFHMEQIELWGAAPHLYVEDLSLTEIKNIRREIESRGLKVVCFTPEQCMYPINLAAKEQAIRERSRRYFEKSIEASAELQSELVLVTAGWGYRNESREEAWKRACDSLQQLAEYASQRGITLALEPLQPVESNLVCNLTDLAEMLRAIGSPAVKGMVDTVAMAVEGEDLNRYFERLGENLAHIHLVDGKPGGHLAWGDGNLPLASYMDILERCGYTGALSLEFTSSQYLMEPDKAVEASLRQLGAFVV